MSLSKLAKAKIKTKEQVTFKPRKIEKIIDVNRLEKKLNEIMELDHSEFTVEEKLKALYVLQEIDSNIDKIRTIRGELPMEVSDLEDEIVGLNTRISNINEKSRTSPIRFQKKQAVKDAKDAIKKYESQQSKVKNNREFDSLNKRKSNFRISKFNWLKNARKNMARKWSPKRGARRNTSGSDEKYSSENEKTELESIGRDPERRRSSS